MDYLYPVLFVIAIWWLSTIVVLYRAGLPERTFTATLAGTVVAAAAGFVVVVAIRDDTSIAAAYLGFVGGLAIWALLEVSYLLGFLTGPRPEACPEPASMWQRFAYGIRACLYHELAILAAAALLVAVTWGAANKIALWTFLIIWLMRWSAKLNIFLGVRNLHYELWPSHLQYLQSYARERDMNPLFPFSMAAAVALLAVLVTQAVGSQGAEGRAGAMLLATILALAVLEHLFLMVRVRDDRLWQIGTRARKAWIQK